MGAGWLAEAHVDTQERCVHLSGTRATNVALFQGGTSVSDTHEDVRSVQTDKMEGSVALQISGPSRHPLAAGKR